MTFGDQAAAAARERSVAAAKALVDPATVPWDATVELFTAGGFLSIHREEMSLRNAVRRFMVLPADARSATGIGLHKPYLTRLNGRPIAMGFLTCDVIRELASVMPASS